VTIGDALAEARRQAGLTITQVSQRTCIRETIIRGIERNDFSACGGDFYARGHIRSIARAEGLAPEPLIREYDATQGATDGITAADVFEPSSPIKLRERRRPNWSLAMLVALAAIVGIATFHFLSGPAKADPAANHPSAVTSHPAQPSGHKKNTTTSKGEGRRAHHIVIALSAVSSSCWVELTTTSDRVIFEGIVPIGTSRSWTEHHAVRLNIGNPGAVTLTVNGKPKTPPAGQPVTLTIRSSPNTAG
jgi:cytoskeletal protein RodZ